MKVLDAADTRALLPYPALADALRAVLLARASGEAHAPPRLQVPLGEAGGTLLVMPAADELIAVTKLVTVHPANAERGQPTIRGEMVAMRADTGERLGILDGASVTARRTAALSLLAARLAPRPEGSLLVVEAGTQGWSHLEAFREGLGTEKVFIRSRGSEKARDLADHAQGLGMEAEVIGDVGEALGEVTLIVTATTSVAPVLPEEVPEDVFVAAVGSFRPDMVELPAGLVRRATVIVDDLEGAHKEAGDLIQAERAGALDWDEVLPLEEALGAGPLAGPVVFESVGQALWDLAAARLAFAEDLP